MKKFALLLCLVTVLVFTFTACELHDHEFAEEWSHDTDYHWHACTVVDGCPVTEDKAAHDYEVTFDEEGNPINKCKVCAYSNDKVSTAGPHDHVFAETYSTSDNFHWYGCTVEGCYEAKDRAEHAFSNPEVVYEDSKMTITRVCLDCGFEQVEVQNVKTEVDDALEWDDAFKNFKLTNFTMDVFFDYGTMKHQNHCVVTETSAYYCIPEAREYYAVALDDGTSVVYYREGSSAGSEGGTFRKINDADNFYLTNAQRETVIVLSFEENFDKFTYDEATGSYVCDEAISARYYTFGSSITNEMYCYNNVVKIVDGKISSITANYYFTESDLASETKALAYYNIGISNVEVPKSIIDSATE